MSIFDKIKNTAFDHVTKIMGESDAVWQSADGDVTGTVLFREPTERYIQNRVEFEPEAPAMEYRSGVFTGLFEAANGLEDTQVVIIKEISYNVRKVTRKFDGDTYVATLEETTA